MTKNNRHFIHALWIYPFSIQAGMYFGQACTIFEFVLYSALGTNFLRATWMVCILTRIDLLEKTVAEGLCILSFFSLATLTVYMYALQYFTHHPEVQD